MTRSLLAGAAGFACWSVLWLTENQALLALFPGAVSEEGATSHTPLLLALLACSIANSAVSGTLTSVIARRGERPVWGLALALLAFGIFVQASFWHLQPVWYHLIFLAALVPATLLGGALTRRTRAGTAVRPAA